MQDYIKSMRGLIGHRKFIHPAARIIVEGAPNEVLFIRRKDNKRWGIPAGAFEEGERIEECIRRELREETGIRIRSMIMIGLSTRPERESVAYPNGDQIQYFTAEFYCADWEDSFTRNWDEVSEICFKPIAFQSELPENEQSAFESLAYYRKTGKVRVD